ncbi:MAG: hypothetical protein M3083_09170 [Actinomycetota bacterium]|nr:hypothetical protein [Actinomycetota bacterium]
MAQRHSPEPAPAEKSRRPRIVGIVLVMALGLVHAFVVARRYHVGSFDDDATYVLAARALAAGHGLTSRAAGGYPLVGVYPPGYPALLSPLAAIWPSGVLAFRVLSSVLFAAIFPLTWTYLARRRVPEPVRLAVLALLALNPVLATYATMVMPEVAFVVVLLLMLLALDRWAQQAGLITWAGAGTVLCAATLLWLKEAGIGLVIGVVAWLVLRCALRDPVSPSAVSPGAVSPGAVSPSAVSPSAVPRSAVPRSALLRKAVLAAVGPAVLFLPLLLMRARVGADLIGSRYSRDLGGVVNDGLVARITQVVPAAVRAYASQAVPRSIVPTIGGFLPNHGPVGAVLLLLTWTAAPLVGVGFVVWCRRYADATCQAVPVYLVGTLIYPFTNERRVILVLPVIVAWYILGATSVFAAANRAASRAGGRVVPYLARRLPVVASLLLLVVLASQFTRDYLYFEGAQSSAPGGSPYMALLRQLGQPRDIVETDYLWTTALYSGHRTTNRGYLAGCDRQPVADAIRADGAAYVLTAALDGRGPVDDACVLSIVAGLPEAVRLYRSTRDLSSVFELVGPGTRHPAVRDRLADAVLDGGPETVVMVDELPQTSGDPAGRYPTVAVTHGASALTWSWKQPVSISQLSLGAAGASTTETTKVEVSMRHPDGTWKIVTAAPGAVGADPRHPFVLATFPTAEYITAVRVVVIVPRGGSATVAAHDVHALGPA